MELLTEQVANESHVRDVCCVPLARKIHTIKGVGCIEDIFLYQDLS
jgi:hypothetical protein